MEIIAKNTYEAWKAVLARILDEGKDFKDHDNRLCREVENLTVHISDPSQDYERPIDKMQDFEWIYPAKDELASIMLAKDSSAIYEFSYGPRIFAYAGIHDQINSYVIPLLRQNAWTRRAVISIFDPLHDERVNSRNVPSMMCIYFSIREGHLSINALIRSNDFFIGWPANIYQLYTLQKHVADKLKVPTGSLVVSSCSAHIFHEYVDDIYHVLGR